MNCEQARDQFSPFLDGEISPVDQLSLSEHLASCERCRTELRAMETALADLKNLAVPRPSVPLDQVIADRVRPRDSILRLRIPAWAAALLVTLAALLAFALRSDHAAPERPLAARMAEAGMVQVGGHWVPSTEAERLREGKVYRDGKFVSAEEVEEEALRAKGYVPTPNGWERAGIRDALAAGRVQTKDGWISEDEERDRLFAKAGIMSLGGVLMEKGEADKLAKGLVRTKDGWKTQEELAKASAPVEETEAIGGMKLSKDLAAQLRQGGVLTKDGVVAAKDLAARLIQAEGLVQVDGKWMPKEVADEIASWSLVRKDDDKGPKNAVTACLDGLRVGDPVKHGLVSLYPLTAKAGTGADAIGLDDDPNARIEVTETGTENLKVRNMGDRPVLIQAGTVLRGGHQDRLPKRDTIAWSGGDWQDVPVYCCEHGRWSGSSSKFEVSHDVALPSLRRMVYSGRPQLHIWDEVKKDLFAVQASSPTGSLRAAYDDAAYQKMADEYQGALMRGLADAGDATGVAMAVGDRLVGAELFGSPDLMRQAMPALLHGLALQALAQQRGVVFSGEVANTKRLAKVTLQEIFSADFKTDDAQARVETLSFSTRRGCAGKAISVDGKLAHFVLFAPAETPPNVAPAAPAPPELGAEKAQKYLSDFEKAMTYGAREDRLAAIDEVAGLCIPGSGEVMAKYLGDKSEEVRVRLATRIGELGDRTAIAGLVGALEPNRKDARVFQAVTLALSRIGDERAVEPLAKLLYTPDDGNVEAVLMALPGPVLRCHTAEGIEGGMSKAIAFGESIFALDNPHSNDPSAKARFDRLKEPILSCLEGMTGQRFANATEARLWWVRNKAAFLKDRAK